MKRTVMVLALKAIFKKALLSASPTELWHPINMFVTCDVCLQAEKTIYRAFFKYSNSTTLILMHQTEHLNWQHFGTEGDAVLSTIVRNGMWSKNHTDEWSKNPIQNNKNVKCMIFTVVYNYHIRISSLTDPKHGNIFVCEKLLHNMHTTYEPQV